MRYLHKSDEPRVRVLLVEDNPLDAKMLGRAADREEFRGNIETVETGEEALETLQLPESNRFELLLLDLNLPGIDGFDVLRALKMDSAWRAIPVIVFSSSTNQQDIDRAYDAGAAAYVTKPIGMDGYRATIGAIDGFWNDFVAYTS